MAAKTPDFSNAEKPGGWGPFSAVFVRFRSVFAHGIVITKIILIIYDRNVNPTGIESVSKGNRPSTAESRNWGPGANNPRNRSFWSTFSQQTHFGLNLFPDPGIESTISWYYQSLVIYSVHQLHRPALPTVQLSVLRATPRPPKKVQSNGLEQEMLLSKKCPFLSLNKMRRYQYL